ncbi:MAG: multicopper oxidase domain-containing protein [Candidatus Nanopelagicales bacterium]
MTVGGKRERPLALPHRLRGARTENLATAHVARRRTFRFRLMVKGKNFARINGQYFRMKQDPVTTRLGSVEEWTLKNTHAKTTAENSQHPFHIHVNDVQVMSVNGRPYHARGLQDVVVIPVNGEVVIRQRFEDFTGKFVFHCHILDHEDGGMMRAVRVVRPRSHHALG